MRWFILFILLGSLTACRTGSGTPGADASTAPAEVSIQEIVLVGPLSQPSAEVSGLAWYGDTLILLPQYPARVGNSVYGIERGRIDDALGGREDPIHPAPIDFVAPGLAELEGFQGYEAIAFDGDTAWVTVECQVRRGMYGWLVKGAMTDGTLILDPASRQRLDPLAPLDNMAYEAVIATSAGPVALYEANGVSSSPEGIRPGSEPLLMPRIPYRITDATALLDGRFWVVNFYWPGDTALSSPDPIAARFGEGPTHAASDFVERLVELQMDANTITYTRRPPIQLALADKGRNWEGIVRYGNGFLLVTDEHPRTILAHVPGPTP
jgi:hypothetical protein